VCECTEVGEEESAARAIGSLFSSVVGVSRVCLARPACALRLLFFAGAIGKLPQRAVSRSQLPIASWPTAHRDGSRPVRASPQLPAVVERTCERSHMLVVPSHCLIQRRLSSTRLALARASTSERSLGRREQRGGGASRAHHRRRLRHVVDRLGGRDVAHRRVIPLSGLGSIAAQERISECNLPHVAEHRLILRDRAVLVATDSHSHTRIELRRIMSAAPLQRLTSTLQYLSIESSDPSPVTLNLEGLISEQHAAEAERASKGSGKTHAAAAVEAFEKAEALLLQAQTDDGELTAEENAQREEFLRKLRINRARASVTAGLYPSAISLYHSLIHSSAAAAQSGSLPAATVLAQALTLHVDLVRACAESGAVEEARNVMETALAIAGQQIATADQADTAAQGELVRARRGLLLQQAQLFAMSKQFDTAQASLQQSVSEYPEHPHPSHYFTTTCALYALALQQGNLATATYAVDMMQACVSGLLSSTETPVMDQFLPTYYRIQAQLAGLQGDAAKARRFWCKLVALDPTQMERWNELQQFLLLDQSPSTDVSSSLQLLFSTAILPPLDVAHSSHIPTAAYQRRMELLAIASLKAGRNGEVDSFLPAHSSTGEPSPASRLASQLLHLDPTSSSPTSVATPAAAASINSSRLSSHLLHFDPTSTASWGLRASASYARAKRAEAKSSESAEDAREMWSGVIKLLQVYTNLLTADLSELHSKPDQGGSGGNAPELTLGLYDCQVLLVDCYLRRNDSSLNDLPQASALLNSIAEQQNSLGSAFPLALHLVWVMFARVSIASGEVGAAMKHYRTALENKPDALEVWEEMSACYDQQRCDQAAEACLQSAMTLLHSAPDTDARRSALRRLHLRLAAFHYSHKQYEKGLEETAKAQ
jgi:tetratricopeptide (TPR) repeat protein